MSTRAQVLIKETGIYLYQHCDGYDLYDIVVCFMQTGRRSRTP